MPVYGACIGALIGSIANTFCSLVAKLIRGQPIRNTVAQEAFRATISTGLGCLGGLGPEGKERIFTEVSNVAMAAWQKVIDIGRDAGLW